MMPSDDRQRKIDLYGQAYDLLVEALVEFPKEMWRHKPSAADWSIHEIVVHIADSEANSFIRCRRAIAEPGSAVLGYDENRWAGALRYHDQDPAESLAVFQTLRRATHTLIQTLPEAVWSHTFVHSDDGPMTLDQWLDVYAAHAPDHIEQMRAVHADWLRQSGSGA